MTVYNAKMDTVFYDETEGYVDEDCEVNLYDDGRIAISYQNEDGQYVVYSGKEDGKGHFILKSSGVEEGEATLHKFEKGKYLDGFWLVEKGTPNESKGFWRIKLQKN